MVPTWPSACAYMTRMGATILKRIGTSIGSSKGIPRWAISIPPARYIMHFPERACLEHRSGYGGNALPGQEVFRPAHRFPNLGLRHGWRPRHVIMAIEDMKGRVHLHHRGHALGLRQTNLAMLQSALPEYKVRPSATTSPGSTWVSGRPALRHSTGGGILRRGPGDVDEEPTPK